jgi:hypothetical protein
MKCLHGAHAPLVWLLLDHELRLEHIVHVDAAIDGRPTGTTLSNVRKGPLATRISLACFHVPSRKRSMWWSCMTGGVARHKAMRSEAAGPFFRSILLEKRLSFLKISHICRGKLRNGTDLS